jgi:Flp pilus assembly protein TadD
VAGLEKAITLDPKNPELVGILAETYRYLRRYQDAEQIEDRLFAIEPDRPEHRTSKAWWTFAETADVSTARAAYEVLPSSVKDDPGVASDRAYLAMCARDFDAAEQVSETEVRCAIASIYRR